jgi:starch synthase (maltosyl-transferring)
VVTVVNLDPYNVQSGWVNLDAGSIGVAPGASFEMHDLLSGQRFTWTGDWHYVSLDPFSVPAHIMVTAPRARTERDSDSFL